MLLEDKEANKLKSSKWLYSAKLRRDGNVVL